MFPMQIKAHVKFCYKSVKSALAVQKTLKTLRAKWRIASASVSFVSAFMSLEDCHGAVTVVGHYVIQKYGVVQPEDMFFM